MNCNKTFSVNFRAIKSRFRSPSLKSLWLSVINTLRSDLSASKSHKRNLYFLELESYKITKEVGNGPRPALWTPVLLRLMKFERGLTHLSCLCASNTDSMEMVVIWTCGNKAGVSVRLSGYFPLMQPIRRASTSCPHRLLL